MLLPLAEERGLAIETSGDMALTFGSKALLLQLTTNLVHNAIVHNLPEQGTVWITTSPHSNNVVLTVENTGEKLTPQIGSHSRRAISARLRTHTQRSRRCRPRPRYHQEHHRGTRRNPHPHPPGRRRALRHSAITPPHHCAPSWPPQNCRMARPRLEPTGEFGGKFRHRPVGNFASDAKSCGARRITVVRVSQWAPAVRLLPTARSGADGRRPPGRRATPGRQRCRDPQGWNRPIADADGAGGSSQ